MVKTKQLFVHKIGVFAQWQTVPFLIYSFSNLQMVAFYGNYTIITDKISLLVNNLTESTTYKSINSMYFLLRHPINHNKSPISKIIKYTLQTELSEPMYH